MMRTLIMLVTGRTNKVLRIIDVPVPILQQEAAQGHVQEIWRCWWPLPAALCG